MTLGEFHSATLAPHMAKTRWLSVRVKRRIMEWTMWKAGLRRLK